MKFMVEAFTTAMANQSAVGGRICLDSGSLRKALRTIDSDRIAVAYLGSAWRKYVNAATLKEIIVSPTLGSNPKAIEEAMQTLGIRNVHFLDQLHAKIYLGKEGALVSSCNLSENGFADRRLHEAGVHVTDTENIIALNAHFDALKARAKAQYPTADSKRDALRKLVELWNRAQSYDLAPHPLPASSPHLRDYSSTLDRIHVVWYETYGAVYNERALVSAVPAALDVGPDEYFLDSMQFAKGDRVRPGDWLLCWRSGADGLPLMKGAVHWIYASHCVSAGFVDDEYPEFVGQAKHLRRPSPPFVLDAATKRLIREALATRKFPKLLQLTDKRPWRVGPADLQVPRFLAYVKAASRRLAARKTSRTTQRA